MTKHPAHDPGNDDWLDRVWQAAPPPEPSEVAWYGVLAHIEARLLREPVAVPVSVRPCGRLGPWLVPGVLGLISATAAAVMLAVALGGHRPTPRPPAPLTPWPVATDDDVEILSMDAGDFLAVVVGEVPYHGPLVLASPDEVDIYDTGHDVEVRLPEDWKSGQPAAPMIIMPLDGGPGKH